MSKYAMQKEAVRQAAIEWQLNMPSDSDYGEISALTARFERLAKRYGLTKEFKENGII